jgi:hypothetical protein
MTINIQNEVALWFDKKGSTEVRCGDWSIGPPYHLAKQL